MRKLCRHSEEQTWQLNWWPLNKYCLKLMLSNRPRAHVQASRETHTQEITVQLQCLSFGTLRFDTVLLSLHLSFSLLFPNTFLFLPSHFSLRQRKLEMQEHIVTVGCFHLHSHLWHEQAWATSAPRLKLGDVGLDKLIYFFFNQKVQNCQMNLEIIKGQILFLLD